MRALVTGGAGPIGSHVVDALLERGAAVAVLDDLTRGQRENVDERATFVQGDIRDRELVGQLVGQSDVVFHLAALNIRLAAARPRHALTVMVDGSFNVIECCADFAKPLIVSSSASVYGLAPRFPIEETTPPYANNTLYGAAKTFTEGVCRSFAHTHGLQYVALRYFNVYGPRMDDQGKYTEVLVKWMERIDAGEDLLIEGDGGTTMDLVYIGDVARANMLAFDALPRVSDDVFNIGTGVETSLAKLARLLIGTMSSGVQAQFVPGREGDVMRRRQAYTIKAKDVLGFEAEVGLLEGLRRTVDWWWHR